MKENINGKRDVVGNIVQIRIDENGIRDYKEPTQRLMKPMYGEKRSIPELVDTYYFNVDGITDDDGAIQPYTEEFLLPVAERSSGIFTALQTMILSMKTYYCSPTRALLAPVIGAQ